MCYIVKSLFCAEKLKELHWTLNATHIPVSVKEAKKRGLEENRNKSALNYTSGPLILCQLLKKHFFFRQWPQRLTEVRSDFI